MKAAVRYYSKGGNTKTIAEAIAEGVGVQAVSITDEPALTEPVDVLFLGGAPYANIMAPELKAYAQALTPQMAGKVVLFTTSNWSRRTILALRKILKGKKIAVDDEHFYVQVLKIDASKAAAADFGKKKSC